MPVISTFTSTDIDRLETYLRNLGNNTRSYFGPHAFDTTSLIRFYEDPKNQAYITTEENRIIAYAIIRQGFLLHDQPRLSAYGIALNADTDASFAPSVADDWQGRGLGKELFSYIINDLGRSNVTRLILWGGVQTANQQAIRYYQQLGFRTLGYFEYHGWNTDMVYEIPGRVKKPASDSINT